MYYDFFFFFERFFVRPCERQLLPKISFSQVLVIAVLRKLGSERVFWAFSELISTRKNSFWLVPTLIFAKNHVFSRFSFSRVSVITFFRNFHFREKKWRSTRLVLTRENSFRLKNQLKISSSVCRALFLWPLDIVIWSKSHMNCFRYT